MREPRPGWWLAGLVAVAVLLPSSVSIPIAAFVLVVVGASRWWVRRVASRVQAQCSVPPWAHFDQRVEALLELRNGSRLPAPWAEIDLPTGLGLGRGTPHRETVVLPPRGSVASRVRLRCTQRGKHHVGPPRVRIGDVFGIGEDRAPLIEPAAVTVFPRIVPLERLGLPAQSPFVTVPSQRSLFVDPSAIAGVREYRAGDPFSAIHWTATARTRQLVVKQYERAEARETLVCLDLCPGGYPRGSRRVAVELAITVAASVLHHSIVAQRLPAGLLAASWTQQPASQPVSLPPRSGQGHLRTMLEFLALADDQATTELAEVLADVGRLPAGTTVLAVTGKLDAGVAAHLLRLAREGVPVAVALTGPSADEDVLTAGNLWLPVYRVAEVTAVSELAA